MDLRVLLTNRWAYANPEERRLQARVFPSPLWRGLNLEMGPRDLALFQAISTQQMEVRSLYGDELVAEGPVDLLCEPELEGLARVLGVTPEELHESRQTFRRKHSSGMPVTQGKPVFEGGTERLEGTESVLPRVGCESSDHLWFASAAFEMLERGGLHMRPAVLLQKALSEGASDFEYVEAFHSGNGRRARMYGPDARTKIRSGGSRKASREQPAILPFWLLLLRLEARRGEVLRFCAAADTAEKARKTLGIVSGVLGRPVPTREDYLRELGVEGFCKVHWGELLRPEARELGKRYELYGKAFSEPGDYSPPGTPLSRPRGPGRLQQGRVGRVSRQRRDHHREKAEELAGEGEP